MPASRTAAFRFLLRRWMPERRFALQLWDGTVLPGNREGPTLLIRSPRALRHLLPVPTRTGLGQGYVAGDLGVDDLSAFARLLDGWQVPALGISRRFGLMAAAVLGGALDEPAVPPCDGLVAAKRPGRAASRAVLSEVSTEFFALFLDRSMTQSCAFFGAGIRTLEEAQRAKMELVCRKLALRPGYRLLDVGCGWGGLSLYAAQHYGVEVLGITTSAPQAAFAARLVEKAGLTEQVQIRVQSYRDLQSGCFDAIASIGVLESLGGEVREYVAWLAQRLEPEGRLVNQAVVALRPQPSRSEYRDSFVFPDGPSISLSETIAALESEGLEVRHAECMREHYVETLSHWIARLEEHEAEAIGLSSRERVRFQRLYLHAARYGFAHGTASVYQLVAQHSNDVKGG